MKQVKVYAGSDTEAKWNAICERFTSNTAAFAVLVENYHNQMEETMDNKFAVLEIGRAFGPTDEIPWSEASRTEFATLAEAEHEVEQQHREMRDRCGYNAWDSHRAIMALQDVELTAEYFCFGGIPGGYSPNCENNRSVTYTVHAGEFVTDAPLPEGWDSATTCPACAELQAQAEAEEMRAEEKRYAQ